MTMNKTTGNNTGVSGSHRINSSGEKMTRVRFIICILGLAALAMSQMSRMVLYQSITQMVEHSESHASRADTTTMASMADNDGSCPWPEVAKDRERSRVGERAGDSASTIVAGPTCTTNEQLLIDTLANQPPLDQVDDGHHHNSFTMLSLVNSTQTLHEHPVIQRSYPRYKWSIQQQNVLLGAFFYSYFLFMILGGRLAEVYGSKYVIMMAVAGSGLINFATPWLADTSYPLLVASRMLMGAIQAGVFPGMYALFGKWLTMTEASIFTPLIKMSLRLGMLLGSVIPGLITGWPNVFYTTGTMSIIWSLAWWVLVSSDPADNQWVSEAELRKINRKKRCHQEEAEEQVNEVNENGMGDDAGNIISHDGEGAKSNCANDGNKPTNNVKRTTPWLKIITCPSVIGLIIVKLTFNYAFDFMSIELPSYLKYVHHASKEQISSITSAIYLVQVILIVFVGWMAKVAVQRRPLGMNKTGVRKLFQGIASFGMSVTFLSLSFNNCNLLYIAILLQFGSLCGMFDSGGEIMLPYDLSDQYPATIMAIANTFAQLSAVSSTTVAALVLGGHGGSFHRWNILIRLVATVNLIGGLCFTCLVKAEPIDFGDGRRDKERKDLEASIGS